MATTTALDGRLERGRQIAVSGRLRAVEDGTWLVLSQSKAKTRYLVDPNKQTCTCPDFETWELPCKHIFAVRFFRDPEIKQGNVKCEETMHRPTYQQDWPAYNAGQVHERRYFERLLHDLCQGIQEPKQKNGRPKISIADMVYAATTKVYSGFSGERASTDIKECREHEYINRAPPTTTPSVGTWVAKS